MLFLQAYAATWAMSLSFALFFVAVAALVWFLRAPNLNPPVNADLVLWLTIGVWFIGMSACMYYIDKPHIGASPVTLDWLFMVSAFLGIPVCMPFFAGFLWAFSCKLRGENVLLGPLALVMLGAFGLGCAVSNMHDLLWCGAITENYTIHYKAGYDLDVFVAMGNLFHIPREVTADYATLGPVVLIMILGEVLVAVTCFVRLSKLDNIAE